VFSCDILRPVHSSGIVVKYPQCQHCDYTFIQLFNTWCHSHLCLHGPEIQVSNELMLCIIDNRPHLLHNLQLPARLLLYCLITKTTGVNNLVRVTTQSVLSCHPFILLQKHRKDRIAQVDLPITITNIHCTTIHSYATYFLLSCILFQLHRSQFFQFLAIIVD